MNEVVDFHIGNINIRSLLIMFNAEKRAIFFFGGGGGGGGSEIKSFSPIGLKKKNILYSYHYEVNWCL